MIGFYSGTIEPKRRLAASVVPLAVLHGPCQNYNQNVNQKQAGARRLVQVRPAQIPAQMKLLSTE
jgi:hypothetical protein